MRWHVTGSSVDLLMNWVPTATPVREIGPKVKAAVRGGVPYG